MKLQRRRVLQLAAGAAALSASSRIAGAQTYPTHPVRVIVPYASGGPTDICARLIAEKLSVQFGRQFYVEDVPGAGGNIGTGQAAKAPADGYTILVTVNSYVINPALYTRVPYDPFRDFDPVTLATKFSSGLLIHPSLPVKTVKDLVAFAKANSEKLSFASPGFGTPSHLLGEQFRVTEHLDLVDVPFNGSGPAVTSVVAGHTPIGFAALSAAVVFAKEDKLRILAVMSKNRSSALPDVPTIVEAGYPDLDGDGWIGVFVPTGTPPSVTTLLYRAISRMMMDPGVKERLAALGFDPVGSTQEAFATQLKIETDKWTNVIRAANIKPE
jgi:tripartite-type tricarboxylate transporter receptor subunit TctC